MEQVVRLTAVGQRAHPARPSYVQCCLSVAVSNQNFLEILFAALRATCPTQMVLPRFITYLLTPWCRVLLEKLTGLQLVEKLPAFHGTRRFITTLTTVRHLSLSWASPIQSIYPHPTSSRTILILSTHLGLGLPSGLFPSSFPSKFKSKLLTYLITYLLTYLLHGAESFLRS